MTAVDDLADYRLSIDLPMVVATAELVMVAQMASPAMLQRKLRANTQEVAYLLEVLETAGVVGPDRGTQPRAVLLPPGDLPAVLARLQAPAMETATPPTRVDLVKSPPALVVEPGDHHQEPGDQPPGMEVVVRPDGALQVRHPGEVEPWEPAIDFRPPLLVRARQAVARGIVIAPDTVVVARTMAVTRQAPMAGVRLMVWTPRGARRAAILVRAWVRDEESLRLLAKHEAAGEGDSYAKVVDARGKRNLAGRVALLGATTTTLALLGLAWWAPTVFAGIFAAVTFLAVLATGRSACRDPKDLGGLGAGALALGALAWWQSPALVAVIPQPPGWVWWSLGVAAVAVLGVLGRKEDQQLVDMPARMTPHEPKRPTADMVIDALCRLGIKDLTPANLDKVHAETRVIAPGVGRSRRGWHLQLELPWAVTAGSVMEKREGLAGALKRELGTVWPSQGPRHPGHLTLFLSDRPMSTSPQEPWPIAETRRVDIFESIPMFTDQEGRWVTLQIAYKRIIIGGESGSGKSFYVRQIGVACALDPRVRLLVFDGKANGDMDPLMPVAHGFYVGAQAEEMAQQLVALQSLEREMDRRSRFLRTLPREENPENKITSPLVDQYPHLAPYEVIVDELQEYTQNEDKVMAKEFARIFTRLSRLGRSAGIWLLIATQYPADGVVPVPMRSNFSTKFCLRVEGHQQVEVILGTGSYAAGLKSNLFTASEAGLSWHKGDGQDPAIVQSVRGLDGPACDQLIEVARAIRKARGLLTGQATDDDIEDAEVVYDIVQDSERVMAARGCGKAQWAELVPWLRELREQWAGLTETELSAAVRSALGIDSRDVRSGDVVRKGVCISDLRKHGSNDDDE